MRYSTLLLLVAGFPKCALAQVAVGTIRAGESRSPLSGAFVALLDTSASVVGGVSTDDRGRFTLHAPEPGTFALMARHPGYQRTITAWLQFGALDSLEVNISLAATAHTLSPIVVTTQRQELLDMELKGVALRTVNGTFVTQAEIEYSAVGTRRLTEVIQNLRIPSLSLRHYRISTGDPRLDGDRTCLVLTRAARNACVTVVIDGLRYTDLDDLLHLDDFISPEQVKAMVFVRPSESGSLFGSESTNGVLLIITKTGAR
ncbi:MAG: carboxypeptidase regulatory-like domain-containing protein [Gemmatimonadaceae bacterium]|nr:carboxypeptidase regulatory-like domain-containing protein [Gemmatimonadaceae bacterium]